MSYPRPIEEELLLPVRARLFKALSCLPDQCRQEGRYQILEEASKLLHVDINQLPARANELFEKWKLARKAVEKKNEISLKELELTSKEVFKGNVLDKISEILKTQPEHVVKTIKRFLNELEEFKKKKKLW